MGTAAASIPSTMRAYRLPAWGKPPEYTTVPVPSPPAGSLLLKVRACGLCRSDLDMIATPPHPIYALSYPAGYILGHESAGTIVSTGEGVASSLAIGDAVIVHTIRKCGSCEYCADGEGIMHCQYFKDTQESPLGRTRGAGLDGGLAEYLVVPADEVVKLPGGEKDLVRFAPLSDAGATAYHAVKGVLSRLRPGSTAVVIGVGGLGMFGVQFIRLLSRARLIALDMRDSALQYASELGADEAVKADEHAAEKIKKLTRGKGADAIIDFVGSDSSLLLATQISRQRGKIVVVGLEGGKVTLGWGLMANCCEFTTSLTSSLLDLHEVVAIASDTSDSNGAATAGARRALRIDVQTFPFDQIPEAYRLLENGEVQGRAVIVFE